MEVSERTTLLRQAAYRYHAGLFLYPEEERLRTLSAASKLVCEDLLDASNTEHEFVFGNVRALVEAMPTGPAELRELQEQWVRLFGATHGAICYPYEGAYGERDNIVFLQSSLQADYARSGLGLSVADLPDHVSVELDFVSFLCGRVLAFLDSTDENSHESVRYFVERQRSFLEAHPAKWLGKLADLTRQQEDGFYAQTARSAAALVEADARYLDALCADPALPHDTPEHHAGA